MLIHIRRLFLGIFVISNILYADIIPDSHRYCDKAKYEILSLLLNTRDTELEIHSTDLKRNFDNEFIINEFANLLKKIPITEITEKTENNRISIPKTRPRYTVYIKHNSKEMYMFLIQPYFDKYKTYLIDYKNRIYCLSQADSLSMLNFLDNLSYKIYFNTFRSNLSQKQKIYIKNTFDKILRIKKIRTSCTCADVKYLKSELQPGESTELIVTLKANSLSGPFTHTIYVETDNPKQRFMRFVIQGNAVPLLKVSPEPVRYIGTLQAGKKYEYKYELVPTNPKEKIFLGLIHPKLPTGTDIKLEKQGDKHLLTVTITPQKDQKTISLNFAVKIKEPKDWADIKFTLNGRIQSSQSKPPKTEKTTP